MSLFENLNWSVVLAGPGRQQLLDGLSTTFALTGVALVCALLLGVLLVAMRLSPLGPVARAAKAYVEFTRSIPLIVHVLFWYYGMPEALPADWRARLYEHDVGFLAAGVALSLYAAAFISEDIRSGIRAIGRGQTEAAHALGFGHTQTLRLVVLPQAVRLTVAPLLGQAMTLAKNTSVALMIGVPELIMQARRLQDATFHTIEAFAAATAAYVLICLVLTVLSAAYERRFVAARPEAVHYA
jgi:polar amino acid transport system permease protein